MTRPMPVTPLCIADDATFWPWHRWPEFHCWPDRERTLVILPLAGSADWGLGHPMDSEETVLLSVLREASRQRPSNLPLLVLPPVRFVLGPDAGCAFAVDPPSPTACWQNSSPRSQPPASARLSCTTPAPGTKNSSPPSRAITESRWDCRSFASASAVWDWTSTRRVASPVGNSRPSSPL